MKINIYKLLKGSSYIDLPKNIKSKKAIINVKNKDNKCLMWSISSAIHPVKNDSQWISKYKKYKDELNFQGKDFSVSLDYPLSQKNMHPKRNKLESRNFTRT